MRPLKLRVLRFAARMAAAAAIAAFAITSCNLPKPTPSGNEGSDTGGTYGTNKQPVREGDMLYDCTMSNIYILYFNHTWNMTTPFIYYSVEMNGYVILNQKDGVLTSTYSKGWFLYEGKASNGVCTHIATSKEVTVNVSGVCDHSLMILKIEELVGGGALTGRMICTKPSGIVESKPLSFPFPPMNHPEIKIELWVRETYDIYGEKTIPWGYSGSKSWEVDTVLRPVEPPDWAP